MKKIDIKQAEPIRKKFTPDWEIRKGTYLYKKVAFDDYNQTLRFLMAIEKPQIELDHFADFMNFYNELTIAITTHDVKGLTQLDFELALHIDKALEQMGARQLDETNDIVKKYATRKNVPLQGQNFDLPVPPRLADAIIRAVPALKKFVVYNKKYGIVGVKLKSGEELKELQWFINQVTPYNQVKIDGKAGPETKNAFINMLYEIAMLEGEDVNPDYTENVAIAIASLTEAMELNPNTEIYIDMDGVLADFFGEWAKIMKVDHFSQINKKHSIDDALQKIRDTEDFWLNLPLLPQAKDLLGLVKKVKGRYFICSSPLADDPKSEPHKREWIKNNLSFFPPQDVYITHNKPKYAKNDDGSSNILIDDYGVNINAWENAGGIGFKYKDHKFERTAKAIKQHMQEPVEEKWSQKYKRSINCSNPKGFSQKAHCAGKKKKESIEESFVKPQFDVEWDEATRYPEFEKIGKEAWIKLAKKGKAVTIKNAEDINNTDAADPDAFKNLDKNKQARALAQLKSGDVEMPIVAVYSDGYKELIGGNTRLTAMMARDGVATVWAFKVPDEVAELAENFADGKKKGKSRPGRVKRSGASCNGSVTSLRKRAKNSSGEKARMYHWCANMKSGRKKK